MALDLTFRGYVAETRDGRLKGTVSGRVVNIEGWIYFVAKKQHMVTAFHVAVKSYLSWCACRGIRPEVPNRVG